MKKILLFTAALAAISLSARGAEASSVSAADTAAITVLMNDLDDIEVVAARVQQTTLSHEQISHDRLNRENTGQNLPYLLSSTPGLQVTSDDGLGVGYTYFRLRGTDHTRINMTVNEVPLNDSESQTVFWVNMTDMGASMQSVDVQRGVGTSTNGSASFGGSLNMRTGDQDPDSHYTISFNGGMYNTFREMLSAHLALPGQWRANARVSKVNSDGFLYRASSDLFSYYTDLGWYGRKTQVVGRFFGGQEKTGMGWDGVDYNTAYGIDGADRRYNPSGEYEDANGNTCYYSNQTDNYAQQHAQLQLTHRFNHSWSLNATLHYTHGGGYYEQYKKKSFSYWGFDSYKDANGNKVKKAYGMYRKYLDNHFYGAVLSTKYVSEPADVQVGMAANNYQGAHFGTLNFLQDSVYGPSLPVDYEYYRSTGRKTDANIYAKANWRVINRNRERLSLYADLQYRFLQYHIDGLNDEDMSPLTLTENYHFFNPKAGLTYEKGGHLLYGSFAIANREPSRANFTENIHMEADGSFSGEMPQSERLYDYELGYTYAHPRFTLGANLYFMDYDNQLVLTGAYNDVGAMSTTNVKDSYRMGIELTAGVKITDWFRWDGNLVLSRNKIRNYEQYIDIYGEDYEWADYDVLTFDEATIAFSPMLTAMSLFTFDTHGFLATIQTNVTSKQYLDNTMNESAALKAFTTTNLNLQYSLPMKRWSEKAPDIRLLCQINNVFNMKYASNGGADASYIRHADGSLTHPWPWYYAQAGINCHAGFVVEF